jgi:hypothetical protein
MELFDEGLSVETVGRDTNPRDFIYFSFFEISTCFILVAKDIFEIINYAFDMGSHMPLYYYSVT